MDQEFEGASDGDQTPSTHLAVPSVQPCSNEAATTEDKGAEGAILAPEEGCGLGSVLLTGAALGLGMLILGAATPDPEPPPTSRGRHRHRRGRNGGRSEAKPNLPLLPQWLFDLDQIRQNTLAGERSLSTKGWDGIKKNTDAIILLGHLVSREVAIKATGLFGHEALVYTALRKKAVLKVSVGWFSEKANYSPVSTFDENNAEKLASKIETELCQMPLWYEFINRTAVDSLKIAIERILIAHAEKSRAATERAGRAREGVNWRSRKKPKPGEDYYNSVAATCWREVSRAEEIEAAGRRAIADLDAGQVVPARSFIARHQLQRTAS